MTDQINSGGWVWINLSVYTPLELAIYGLGCFLWVIVYCIYAYRAFKLKYIEMPFFAGCTDFGWEFVWSFLAVSNMGMLFQVGSMIWFFLDLFFIFGSILLFGWKQLTFPELQKRSYFVPICLFISASFGIATYFMHTQGLDTAIGAHSAWLSNLFISFLYIPLMLRQKDLRNFSYAVAWLKMLGTGLPGVFVLMHYLPQGNYFLTTLAVATTTVDCTYIYLYRRRRRQLQQQSDYEAANVASISLASRRSLADQPSVKVG